MRQSDKSPKETRVLNRIRNTEINGVFAKDDREYLDRALGNAFVAAIATLFQFLDQSPYSLSRIEPEQALEPDDRKRGVRIVPVSYGALLRDRLSHGLLVRLLQNTALRRRPPWGAVETSGRLSVGMS